jgi:lipid II:glycine glycyltransferase (peptidoglycan interpeptide bridge formation enzyme)
MDRAVMAAHAHGCAWLDLGTTSIQGVLNPGLCQFKEGFGGIPFQRLTWRLEI